MMKFRMVGLVLALTLGVFSSAHAALLLEPVLGYNVSSKVTIEGDITNREESYSGGGMAYGGRIGYQNLGFQLGLDYLNSSVDLDDNDFDSNFKSSEWGAFVGFEFPILLRVYAGYIFSATAESKITNGLGGYNAVDFNSGTGAKAGVGFTLLPFLDVNFEYRRLTYEDFKAGGQKFERETDANYFMLGISLPFTI